MAKFDYSAPAELFPSRNRKVRSLIKDRRFAKAAHAIRIAMEELPEPQLLGAVGVLTLAVVSLADLADVGELRVSEYAAAIAESFERVFGLPRHHNVPDQPQEITFTRRIS